MSSANWFNGTADVVWNNNDFAVFAGNPGVVELSTGINAGSVTFNTANYTLANDTTGSVSFGCDVSGIFSIGGTADISLTGDVQGALTKVGSDILTLGGSVDNWGLGATVDSGTLVLAKDPSSANPDVHAIGGGGLTINGGIVQLAGSGGDQIWNGAGVTVSGGTFDLNGRSENFNGLNFQSAGSLVNVADRIGVVELTELSA